MESAGGAALWGALGGAVAALVLYVLPWAYSRSLFNPTRRKRTVVYSLEAVITSIVVVMILIAAGAGAALRQDHHTVGGSFQAGLYVQSLIRGVGGAIQSAFR